MLRTFAAVLIAVFVAQPAAPKLATSTGIPGLVTTMLVFNAADANKDGVVMRDELEAAVAKWIVGADASNSGAVTRDHLLPALTSALPLQSLAASMAPAGRGGQPQTPQPNTVQAMMAALPASAPAKPARTRKVLVLARAPASFTRRFRSPRRPSTRSARRPARGRRRFRTTRPTSIPRI